MPTTRSQLVPLAAACVLACNGAHQRIGDETDGGPPSIVPTDGGITRDAEALPQAPESCEYVVESTLWAVDVPDWDSDAPRLVWNGSDLSIVYFASHSWEHPVVRLVNVDLELTTASDPTTIGEESHAWAEAAWTGEALGLCWYSDPGYVGRTAFRLHSANGVRVGERADVDLDGGACVALASSGGRFFAAWRRTETVDEEPLTTTMAQVLDGEGAPVAEPLDLAYGSYPGRSVTVTPWDGGFLAAVPGEDAIRLVFIALDGSSTELAAPAAAGVTHAAVGAGHGRLLLAWLSGERGERGLHVTVLDDRLETTVPDWHVTRGRAGAGYPEVLPTAEGWILTWVQGDPDAETPLEDTAVMLHLGPEGSPEQPRTVLHVGPNSGYGGPSATAVEQDLYVAISHPPEGRGGTAYEQVHVSRLRCRAGAPDICAPQSALAGPETCRSAMLLGHRWDGEGCAELWGCSCVGEDCGRLAADDFACRSDRFHCSGR